MQKLIGLLCVLCFALNVCLAQTVPSWLNDSPEVELAHDEPLPDGHEVAVEFDEPTAMHSEVSATSEVAAFGVDLTKLSWYALPVSAVVVTTQSQCHEWERVQIPCAFDYPAGAVATSSTLVCEFPAEAISELTASVVVTLGGVVGDCAIFLNGREMTLHSQVSGVVGERCILAFGNGLTTGANFLTILLLPKAGAKTCGITQVPATLTFRSPLGQSLDRTLETSMTAPMQFPKLSYDEATSAIAYLTGDNAGRYFRVECANAFTPERVATGIENVSPVQVKNFDAPSLTVQLDGVLSVRPIFEPTANVTAALVSGLVNYHPIEYEYYSAGAYPGAIYRLRQGSVFPLRISYPSRHGVAQALSGKQVAALLPGADARRCSVLLVTESVRKAIPVIIVLVDANYSITSLDGQADLTVVPMDGKAALVHIVYPCGRKTFDLSVLPPEVSQTVATLVPAQHPSETLTKWIGVALNFPFVDEDWCALSSADGVPTTTTICRLVKHERLSGIPSTAPTPPISHLISGNAELSLPLDVLDADFEDEFGATRVCNAPSMQGDLRGYAYRVALPNVFHRTFRIPLIADERQEEFWTQYVANNQRGLRIADGALRFPYLEGQYFLRHFGNLAFDLPPDIPAPLVDFDDSNKFSIGLHLYDLWRSQGMGFSAAVPTSQRLNELSKELMKQDNSDVPESSMTAARLLGFLALQGIAKLDKDSQLSHEQMMYRFTGVYLRYLYGLKNEKQKPLRHNGLDVFIPELYRIQSSVTSAFPAQNSLASLLQKRPSESECFAYLKARLGDDRPVSPIVYQTMYRGLSAHSPCEILAVAGLLPVSAVCTVQNGGATVVKCSLERTAPRGTVEFRLPNKPLRVRVNGHPVPLTDMQYSAQVFTLTIRGERKLNDVEFVF